MGASGSVVNAFQIFQGIELPEEYKRLGCKIEATHHRAISIKQLELLGKVVKKVLRKYPYIIDPNTRQRITEANVNLYNIDNFLVKPLTKDFNCSFVELISSGPQTPKWFVSHFWGTPFFDTLRMLKLHAKSRNVSRTDEYYWICAFANNQHNLDGELKGLLETPFYKAIMSDQCQGTVSILDEEKASPFTRIWCIFENYVTLTDAKKKPSPHFFDFCTIIPEGECLSLGNLVNERCAGVLLDSGNGEQPDETTDHPINPARAWFPSTVAMHGFHIDVRQAKATRDTDRINILNMIGGKEDDVNFLLRKQFAGAALYMACTQLADVAKVKEMIESGIMGNQEEAAELADEEGCLADLCEYFGANRGNAGEHESCVAYLLEIGCDPNNCGTDRQFATALQCAFHAKNYNNVRMLLEYGADLKFVGRGVKDGLPSLRKKDIPTKGVPDDIMKLLEEAGTLSILGGDADSDDPAIAQNIIESDSEEGDEGYDDDDDDENGGNDKNGEEEGDNNTDDDNDD